MLSVSRPAKQARTPIARIFLAVMLALGLLSGALPLSSFASSHACAMACCLGKPPHMAGSCSVSFGEGQPEMNVEPGAEHSTHGHMVHSSGATSAEVSPVKHQGAVKHSAAHHSSSAAEESRPAASVASQVMTAPCSPECAAAALGSSQVRRPRDAASPAISARPRAPALLFSAGHLFAPLPESAERRSLARPRAPPPLPNNLSA